MSEFDEERVAELLRRLTPPPEPWVRAAQQLPAARASLDGLIARAEADAAFRAHLLADLEAALAAEGVEPTRPLLDEVRRRVDAE